MPMAKGAADLGNDIKTFGHPDVAFRANAETGEGPVWDKRTGHLVWVDLSGGQLIQSDPATGRQTVLDLGMSVGAAVPRSGKDGFAVAVADGFGYVVDGQVVIADAALPERYRRMNDAKCDSRGRLWAGSTHTEYMPGIGSLHCWDGFDTSTVVRSGFTLPNGIGWNADDTIMYLVDSMSHQLLSAAYRSEDGEVGEFVELCRIESGLPDGLAVDIEGFIWVAVWGGAEVRRYDPLGRFVGRVPMPVDQPSSCTFADDGTLYITSAWAGLDETSRSRQPLAGSVFALSTGTRGVPVCSFRN